MLWIGTDNKQNAFSFYDFALYTDFFHRSPNFHNFFGAIYCDERFFPLINHRDSSRESHDLQVTNVCSGHACDQKYVPTPHDHYQDEREKWCSVTSPRLPLPDESILCCWPYIARMYRTDTQKMSGVALKNTKTEKSLFGKQFHPHPRCISCKPSLFSVSMRFFKTWLYCSR